MVKNGSKHYILIYSPIYTASVGDALNEHHNDNSQVGIKWGLKKEHKYIAREKNLSRIRRK
jgi:hypothetical protein